MYINDRRSTALQKQEQAAQHLTAELTKANEAGLDPHLDNLLNDVLQAAGQLIVFVVERWKTLNKGVNAAQQRVAELVGLCKFLAPKQAQTQAE